MRTGTQDTNAFIQFGFAFAVGYRIDEDVTEPLIIQVKADTELEDGQVVFRAWDYSEWKRRYTNGVIRDEGHWP